MGEHYTFAVVGHNEEDTLANAVGQAFEAAEPGDAVWFLDSASTDNSADVAAALGAEVISAPLGKGRAMAIALDTSTDGFTCFLDADIVSSERNIPRCIRDAAVATGADMVVGAFNEPARRLAVTPSLYIPLRGALFPELVDSDVAVPLSGFRAVRVGLSIRDLPGGYGAETHLNLEVPLGGGRVVDCDLGTYEGKLREYSNIPAIGIDVAKALLDAAEAHGRLQHDARPEWDAWVAAVVSAMTSQPRVGADDSAYVERLLSTAARPLPSTR